MHDEVNQEESEQVEVDGMKKRVDSTGHLDIFLYTRLMSVLNDLVSPNLTLY